MTEEIKREQREVVQILELNSINNEAVRRLVSEAYNEMFKDEAGTSAQLQRCYSPEDLEKVLLDENHVKFLAVNARGELFSCCIIATRPEDISAAYANPAKYLEGLQPGEKLWYVTALFSPKKMDQSTTKLLEKLADRLAEENAVLGYDHSEHNSQLPEMIRFVAERHLAKNQPNLEFKDEVVGSQTYRQIRLNRKQ